MAIINPIAKKYAESLYTLASTEKCLERVDDEITTIKTALDSNLELKEFLKNDNVQSEGKKKAIFDLFGEISPITLSYINLLVDLKRLDMLQEVIEVFSDIMRRDKEVTTVLVTTATPLNDEIAKELEERLEKMLGRDVYIKRSIDESIVGGLVIRMGDEVFDGSIRGQLEKIKIDIVSNI